MAAFFCMLGRQLELRIAEGFARGDHGELREAVELRVLAADKMLQRIEAADLRAVRHFQADAGDVRDLQRTDAGAAFGKGFPVFGEIQSERRNDSQPGDGDAARGHPLDRRAGRAGARLGRSGGKDLLDAVDDVVDGLDGADVVVGNGNLESVFEFEEQCENVEGIDAHFLEVRVDA